MRYDVLISEIQKNDFKIGAEVGVKRGDNVRKIVQACPDFVIHAIDAWDPKLQYLNWGKNAQRINEQIFDKLVSKYPQQIIKHKGYSLPVAAEFDDASLDIIFIDGDHSYEGCKADIEAWLPKLREGGVMAGHDYEHPQFPGVKKSVDEIFDEVEVFSDMVWLIRKK